MANAIDVRPCVDDAEREEIFALRHDAYCAAGVIDRQRDGRFLDEYDSQDNVVLLGAFEEEELVGSIRTCLYDPLVQTGIPELAVYADISAVSDARRHRCASGNRLVVRADRRARERDIAFALLKYHCYLVSLHAPQFALAAVRDHHVAFYRRFLRMRPLSGPRSYKNMNSMFVLCFAHFPHEYPRMLKAFPQFRVTGWDPFVDRARSAMRDDARGYIPAVSPARPRRSACGPSA